MGSVVAALSEEGHHVIGIERSTRLVEQIMQNAGHLDICWGDVEALDFPAGTVGCYISIGVVEHNPEGPWVTLNEARRVLSQDGTALISVPFLNPSRKRYLKRLVARPPSGNTLTFHQYYFDREEFLGILNECGLVAVEMFPYAAGAFLTREHPVFSRFWASRWRREPLRRFWLRQFKGFSPTMRWRYAHMLMVACEAA